MIHPNLNQNHNPFGGIFANAVERTTYPYTTLDLYKIYLQEDDKSIWMLSGVDPYPVWTPVGGGGSGGSGAGSYELINSFTATAQPSVEILDVMTSEFDQYIIELIDVKPSVDDATLQLEMSDDNGSTYPASGYNFQSLEQYTPMHWGQWLYGSNASAFNVSTESGNAAGENLCGTIKILNANGDSKKYAVWELTMDTSDDQFKYVLGSGYLSGADAITAVKLSFASSNITGTVRIYGLRSIPVAEAESQNTVVVATSGINVTVSNTVTETDLIAAINLPTLLENSTIKISALLDINHTVAGTLTLRLKLAGTTILTFTIAEGLVSAMKHSIMNVIISNQNDFASQSASGLIQMHDHNTQVLASWASGSTTIDMSAIQTLSLTAQWGSANAGLSVTLVNHTIEVLK